MPQTDQLTTFCPRLFPCPVMPISFDTTLYSYKVSMGNSTNTGPETFSISANKNCSGAPFHYCTGLFHQLIDNIMINVYKVHWPGVPDMAAWRACLTVGMMSLTRVTVAQNLHRGLNRLIWSMSCRAPRPCMRKLMWKFENVMNYHHVLFTLQRG